MKIRTQNGFWLIAFGLGFIPALLLLDRAGVPAFYLMAVVDVIAIAGIIALAWWISGRVMAAYAAADLRRKVSYALRETDEPG